VKKIVILAIGGNEQYVRDILHSKGFKTQKIASLVVEPTKHGPVSLSEADLAELLASSNVFAVVDGDL
jgi:hypothetical protein